MRFSAGHYRIADETLVLDSAEIQEQSFAPQVIQFSDSIIRVRCLELGSAIAPIGTFFAEIRDLAYMQLESMANGFCLRGAVTVGNVHVGRHGAFGPAFIRAYELETQLALVPRVIVDPVFFSWLSKREFQSQPQEFPIEPLVLANIRTGDDGIQWIDYFGAASDYIDRDTAEHYFGGHKATILKYAFHSGTLTSIAAKYLWLASYHNAKVVSYSSFLHSVLGPDFERLFVTESEFPLLRATS